MKVSPVLKTCTTRPPFDTGSTSRPSWRWRAESGCVLVPTATSESRVGS